MNEYFKYDDSFYGTIKYPEKTGLPFQILIPFQKAEDDLIPRIFIMYKNPIYPYRSKYCKMYQIIDGKIERIDIYKRDWNQTEEELLQKFVAINLKAIKNYFISGTNFKCVKV